MAAKLADIKDCPGWPRWLSAEQAAAYVGVAVNTFLWEVEQGKWAKPEKRGPKGARLTWDRALLDAASNLRSGITPANENGAMSPAEQALRLLGA